MILYTNINEEDSQDNLDMLDIEDVWLWVDESEVVVVDEIYSVEVKTDDVAKVAIGFDENDNSYLVPLHLIKWL